MSNISHHPRYETLAEFAAGRLEEARAVVIATHAAICTQCAQQISDIEAIGGAMLEAVEPVEMAHDALERVLSRADPAANVVALSQLTKKSPENHLPLSAYLEGSLDDVQWRPVAPGISQSVIEANGYRKGALRLLKISPGVKMPRHSHQGEELTLILRGAYEDSIGEWRAGDLADLTTDHTHEPQATGDEPCICLIATSAPLEFKTWIGRAAQPFVGL